MNSRIPWAKAGGLLTAGVAIGLAIGAWRWRGAEREGTTARTDEPADIGRPPLLGRGADGAGVGRPAPGGRAMSEPDPVSAAVIKVNALKSSGRSGKMLAHAEMMAAVGALDAAQCARLLQTLAESGEWDPESAIYPLLHWATRDPAAALNFALGHQDFQSTEPVSSPSLAPEPSANNRDGDNGLALDPRVRASPEPGGLLLAVRQRGGNANIKRLNAGRGK